MSIMDHFSGYQYGLKDHFRVHCHQHESICEINGHELDNKAYSWFMVGFLCLIWQHGAHSASLHYSPLHPEEL